LSDSRIKGFYKLSVTERIDELASGGWLTAGDAENLRQGRFTLLPTIADRMVENVVGVFGLPLAVAPNFAVNGRDYLVPLVVEEPSIVAGTSKSALLARKAGGFTSTCDDSLLIGQVHISDIDDVDAAIAKIEAARKDIIAQGNTVHPRLVQRGGGVMDIEVRRLSLADGNEAIAVHMLVDTRDAMGANLVNSICEVVAPAISDICGGNVALRILSNLADRSLVTACVQFNLSDEVRDGVVLASEIACADPYRAATHNKGIMNGIDALAIATGNDWRAIEAGAHAYAARDGQYRPLATWSVGDDGDLVGEICIPLKVGSVGGNLDANRGAALGLALCGVESATELAELMAAVGLAQNFAALHALATSGIQQGHMKLHARSVASSAGVPDELFDEVVDELISGGEIKAWKAQQIVAEKRGVESEIAPDGIAAGKVILLGEHAVVYGKHALASKDSWESRTLHIQCLRLPGCRSGWVSGHQLRMLLLSRARSTQSTNSGSTIRRSMTSRTSAKNWRTEPHRVSTIHWRPMVSRCCSAMTKHYRCSNSMFQRRRRSLSPAAISAAAQRCKSKGSASGATEILHTSTPSLIK
jgi:hydroxymethylglutaryl-CoA reductase